MIKRKRRHHHRQRIARRKILQCRTYGLVKSATQANNTKEFPRPLGCPPDSIALDRSEFNRLNCLYCLLRSRTIVQQINRFTLHILTVTQYSSTLLTTTKLYPCYNISNGFDERTHLTPELSKCYMDGKILTLENH